MTWKFRYWFTIGALLAIGALSIREIGFINFTLYRSWSHSDQKWQTSKFDPYEKLDIIDVQARDVWTKADVSGYPHLKIYYCVNTDRPWGRWLPLFKFGDTHITKRFVVLSPSGKIACGSASSKVSCTVFGSISVRGYSELVENKDVQEYLKSIAKLVHK